MDADHSARLRGPEREERCRPCRVRVSLLGAERRAEQVLGEKRSERPELLSLENGDVEPGRLLDHALLVQEPQLVLGLGHHQPARDVEVETAAQLLLQRVPYLGRLCVEADLGLEPIADAGRLRPR